MENPTWGYKPSTRRKLIRLLCRFLIFVFRFNGRSKFSNEFIQLLDPKIEVVFDNQKLIFRTGNGRLLWRAKSLSTEEPLMSSWIRSMTPDDVVLDIGANVGMYSIPMAKKSRIVYACELDPLNVAILRENMYLNSSTGNVVVLPFASGESSKIVNVRFRDLSYGDALQSIEGGDSLATKLGLRTHSAYVVQFPLDDLFVLLDLHRPNKIKIDVDGNERAVLSGTSKLLCGAREIYFEDGRTPACADFVSFLIRNDFVEVSRETQLANGDEGLLVYTKLFVKSD